MRQRQGLRNVNKLEKAGYAILEDLGLEYQPQQPVGRFVFDALIPSLSLAIQFDGDYWHGNPEVFPESSARQLKQREIDRRADDTAKNMGFQVLRFWESTIKTDPKKVKDSLLSFKIQEK